jgi:hypothetical protein
VFLGANLVS